MRFRTNISPFVQKNLLRKMERISRNKVNGMLETKDYNSNDSPWGTMITKGVWARCTTPRFITDDQGKALEELGLMRLSSAYKDGTIIQENISTQNPLKARSNKGNIYTLDKNEIFRGASGITNISVDTKNFFMNKATVSFQVPNPREFEVLQEGFLKHGNLIFLEFGYSTEEIDTGVSYEKTDFGSFVNMQSQLTRINETSSGNYNGMLGVIVNFSFNINSSGIYECSFDIASQGINVLGQHIQKGGVDDIIGRIAESTSKDEKVDDETLKRFEKNFSAFESVIENLEEVVEEYTVRSQEKKKDGFKYKYLNGALHITNWEGIDFLRWGGPVRGYVSWGWFEDIVLNHYFSLMSKQTPANSFGKDFDQVSDDKFRTSIRSTSFLDENGDGKYQEYNNTCNSHPYLVSHGLTTSILPGNTIFEKKPPDSKREMVGLFRAIDKEFPSFEHTELEGNPNDEVLRVYSKTGVGVIRNMVFPTGFLKQHFTGISSIEQGLKSFWSSVSSLYGNFWSFDVVNDDFDSGRIGMVEYHGSSGVPTDIDYYSDYKDKVSNSSRNLNDYLNYEKGNTNPDKMFLMPIYSDKSIVKDFSLDVKMNSQMAVQAVYGGQANIENSSGTPPHGMDDLGVRALGLLFNTRGTKKFKKKSTPDEVMKEIVFAIEQDLKPGSTISKSNEPTIPNPLMSNSGFGFDFRQVDAVDNSTRKKIDKIEKMNEEYKGKKAEDIAKELKEDGRYLFYPKANLSKLYNDGGEMDEYFEKVLLFLINESQGTTSVAGKYYSTTIPIPIRLSLTIDGTGGLRIGNLFVVDYLPEIYRQATHFMITKIGHDITPGGWFTKLEAVMQVNIEKLREIRKYNETDEPIEIKNYDEFSSIDKAYEDLAEKLIGTKPVKKSKKKKDRKKEYVPNAGKEYEDNALRATQTGKTYTRGFKLHVYD